MEAFDMKALGERIKAERKAKGWSLEEMEYQSGVNRTTIVRYEKGNLNPSLYTAVQIAKALEISLDWMVYGDGKE